MSEKVTFFADKLAEQGQISSHIAKVDCTRTPTLCKRFRISGYPTLLHFSQRGNQIHKYQGSRTLELLGAFAKGGWKQGAVYDPSAIPPAPPSKMWKKYKIMGYLFVFIVALGPALVLLLWLCDRVSKWFAGGESKRKESGKINEKED